ncbi:small GTP-binding protein [Histomonas meleagridis]|uniref:small GTP-binding protein n=1 Tax=Histomonas meleagridis TaxID=135588 RepID=UPI0035598F29|nr:small GTP-binding protein [Histomonas meleagridis]KAH0796526.1 small GTP-binding protein [Histomonas meleagridis]
MTATEIKKTLKLILVGSGGVGKTSLVTKFYNQQFETQTLPTVAPAFCSANIPLKNGLSVELQIWDTAGQEQYQAICQMFYHDSNIAFVCFDKSNIDTVEQWVLRVRSQVPDCLIILVSTKVDLLSSEELIQLKKDGKEMVSKYKAEAHFLTSSQTGQEVTNLFYEAANCIEKIQDTNIQKKTPLEENKNQDGSNKCSC